MQDEYNIQKLINVIHTIERIKDNIIWSPQKVQKIFDKAFNTHLSLKKKTFAKYI